MKMSALKMSAWTFRTHQGSPNGGNGGFVDGGNGMNKLYNETGLGLAQKWSKY